MHSCLYLTRLYSSVAQLYLWLKASSSIMQHSAKTIGRTNSIRTVNYTAKFRVAKNILISLHLIICCRWFTHSTNFICHIYLNGKCMLHAGHFGGRCLIFSGYFIGTSIFFGQASVSSLSFPRETRCMVGGRLTSMVTCRYSDFRD